MKLKNRAMHEETHETDYGEERRGRGKENDKHTVEGTKTSD